MKKKIEVWDHAGEILSALPGGVLLVTKADGAVNAMTIGWGMLGIEWSLPVFTAFVREGRYTRQMLDRNPEFVVSVPHGPFSKKILGICGSKSGRDVDKVHEAGLTLCAPSIIDVPAILELPLTLECRVIYKQLQLRDALSEDLDRKYYPPDIDSSAPGANKDRHIAYYGEILASYIET